MGKHWSMTSPSTILIAILGLAILTQIAAGLAAKRRLSSSSKLANAALKSGGKQYKVVCYYTNWSQYRPKTGKFTPEDIEPHLCTHIIFAFGWLKKGKLATFEENDDSKPGKKGLYEKITDLKLKNTDTKVLLAIGGWSFGTEKFKDMSGNRYSRQTFILDAIPYLRTRDFDGLDIDWEYPKGEDDKKNYVSLLRELYEAFQAESEDTGKPRLLLTAAVPAGAESVRAGFNVPEVVKYLDFINLMAYDFHGKWESQTGHNSPLYAPSSDSNWRKQLCVDYSANMWVRMGAPREKLIIGTGTYGRSFKLAELNKNEVNSPSTGGGVAGQYTKEEGVLAYYEVCEMLKDPATIYVWDNEMQVPFCYKDDQWVGFDDERSIKNKMQWIKDNGFGGAMVWTVDFDDFHGICGNGNYPLISIISQELLGRPRPQGNKITDWSEGKPKHRKPTINDIATTQPELDGVPQQELSAAQLELAGAKIICYFTTWSSKRSGRGKFLPSDIDTSLCTHVVIAFATVKDGKLAAPTEVDQSLYDSVIDLKKKKSSLKVLLAVGGWNFGSKPFRDLTGSSFKRNIFVYDAVDYLRKHSFDGLDVDWEYPRGNDEKERYALLLKELREAFDGEANANKVPPLLLSAAVPANFEVLANGYDVAEISKHLDLINVMTYDFHGLWETQIGHNSPLKPMTGSSEYLSKLTTDYSAREWIRLGAPKEKLMIGMATYGRSFTLEDTKKFDIGDSAIGGGRQGKFTKESGILAFYEICDFLRANATLVWDEEQGVPFAYKGNQWVGFDDERSITGKVEWLKSNELGGVMVWSVDLDDFTGYCGGPSYPLLTMINKQLQNYTVPGVVLQQVASQVKKVTIEEIVCKEEDGVITYHQDKRDCTKYYMCEGDRRHHMPCPVNLVFNINQNVCDWPENVDGCANSGKSR